VLGALHDQAVAKKYDVVLNLESTWRDKAPETPGVYTCAVGTTVVAVELKGMAFRSKKATPPAAVARSEVASNPVVVAESAAGKSYSVLLGSAAVGAKLQATPDRAPDEVQLALAFRTKQAEAPHKDCTLGVSVGSESLALQGARYERGPTQETLYAALSLAQAERLAAQDGAFTACETRVQVTSGTRAKIAALIEAIRGHATSVKTVQRGDSLSL
jgi:hypothetical protein